jgi:hypothetical protein
MLKLLIERHLVTLPAQRTPHVHAASAGRQAEYTRERANLSNANLTPCLFAMLIR